MQSEVDEVLSRKIGAFRAPAFAKMRLIGANCAEFAHMRIGGVMKGSTLTRADLCEAVHEEVGLTRQDCAGLVERTLDL
ncbi:conserved hypothetical protein, partial [Ricinus communis]